MRLGPGATIWLVMAALALSTVALKALPPALLGDGQLPPRLRGVLDVLPPVVLSALVTSSTFASGSHLVLDARAGGLLAALLVLLVRPSPLLAAIAAAAVAAGLRAAGLAA